MNNDLFSLEGRTALVTGGNGGLGRAIALGLCAAGAQVAVTGRNLQKNEAMGRELGDPGLVFPLNVEDEVMVQAVVAEATQRLGHLDILVNNAGIYRGGPVVNLAKKTWDEVLGAHLTGSFLCAKHAARAMIANGQGGKIINIGSMYSVFGSNAVDYVAAKTGALGLTRALAIELAANCIQVNAILPGWFETDMTRGLPDLPRGEEIRQHTPAGRWGEPEDLVGVAVFLASSASDFITGAAIPVDGGYSINERLLASNLPDPRGCR